MLLDRSTRETRVIARAPKPDGLIAWLVLDDSWAVWADYTDRATAGDWRVRAISLPSGSISTVMSAPADATIGDRPEFALDGDRLVIAVRPPGATHMRLIAVDLDTGQSRVLLEAEPTERFGWPSISGERIVVESHRQGSETVYVLDMEGRRIAIVGSAEAPASEPSLAGDLLAYKAAARYSQGPLVIRDLSTGKETALPSLAEAPVAGNGKVVWRDPKDRYLHMLDASSGRSYTYDAGAATIGLYGFDGTSLALQVRPIDRVGADEVRVFAFP